MPVFDVYDDKEPRRIVIDDKRITIGRTDDNGIVIDDRQSSRKHCEVRLSEIGYVVNDLKSRNGTLLNQDLIDRPIPLQNGDEIGIGAASIRFWESRKKIPNSAAKLPLILKSSPKTSAVKTKTSRTKTTSASTAYAEEVGIKLDIEADSRRPAKMKLVGDNQAKIPAHPAGPLTLHNIIPLNHENKPAHPVSEDGQEEVSQAMLKLKEILLKSLQLAATDIHIEPKEEHLDLRYRIDGYLHRAGTLEQDLARSVYSIVKLLCNLQIDKKGIMQDGSFALQLPDRRIDLRVSIAPSTLGDKMVVRILDAELAPKGLDSLGLEPYIHEQIRTRAFKESSMIVSAVRPAAAKPLPCMPLFRKWIPAVKISSPSKIPSNINCPT